VKDRIRRNIEISFVTLQVILYVSFLLLDFIGSAVAVSNYIKFTIIILCFCYALFLAKGADKSILFCMKTALFFTVISDLFLLILNHYLIGVITFIIVQQLYGIRLILAKNRAQEVTRTYSNDCSRKKVYISNPTCLIMKTYACRLVIQIAISELIYLVIVMTGMKLDSLLMISVFYFVCISTNTLSAILFVKNPSRVKGDILFAIGMVLFLLCDINVGIFNLSEVIILPENILHVLYTLSSILMWFFYAPSQVIISLSTTKMSVKKY